jgi:hypothetical protein
MYTFNMAAAYSGPADMHFAAAAHLGGFYGLRYGAEGGFDIYHYPFAQSGGRAEADPGNFNVSVFAAFTYDSANLGRAYIKAHD